MALCSTTNNGKKKDICILCFDMLCRCYLGVELLSEGSESNLKTLWHHSDAVMCCSLKVFFNLNPENLQVLCLYSALYSLEQFLCSFFHKRSNHFSMIIKPFFMSEHVANLQRCQEFGLEVCIIYNNILFPPAHMLIQLPKWEVPKLISTT